MRQEVIEKLADSLILIGAPKFTLNSASYLINDEAMILEITKDVGDVTQDELDEAIRRYFGQRKEGT